MDTKKCASSATVATLLLGLLISGSAGCGGSQEVERVTAWGQVFLNGERLSNAAIVLEPKNGGGIRASTPIKDGLFEFTRSNGPTAGEFDVRINPECVEEAEALELMQRQQGKAIVKSSVPLRYQRPGALSAAITAEGPNHLAFFLTSK